MRKLFVFVLVVQFIIRLDAQYRLNEGPIANLLIFRSNKQVDSIITHVLKGETLNYKNPLRRLSLIFKNGKYESLTIAEPFEKSAELKKALDRYFRKQYWRAYSWDDLEICSKSEADLEAQEYVNFTAIFEFYSYPGIIPYSKNNKQIKTIQLCAQNLIVDDSLLFSSSKTKMIDEGLRFPVFRAIKSGSENIEIQLISEENKYSTVIENMQKNNNQLLVYLCNLLSTKDTVCFEIDLQQMHFHKADNFDIFSVNGIINSTNLLQQLPLKFQADSILFMEIKTIPCDASGDTDCLKDSFIFRNKILNNVVIPISLSVGKMDTILLMDSILIDYTVLSEKTNCGFQYYFKNAERFSLITSTAQIKIVGFYWPIKYPKFSPYTIYGKFYLH